ncbi:MAG TPA: hypothetical protein VM934_10770 [Pyrinomonadaceae bacterium]|jgi:hypothetical protein|nr:hypothetical protein [Pyrinomonadaceae bacterium]
MSTFRNNTAAPRAHSGTRAGEESPADLSSLLHYPSLGRLFEGADTSALEDMRARLARTNQELERVLRQGPKEDAERASRASQAVGVTLALLEELERMRRGAGEADAAK